MIGAEAKATYSRAAVAEWAAVQGSQLEYLVKQGILVPDAGGVRKRFSLLEARLAVVVGAMLPYVANVAYIKGPIIQLREEATFPDADVPRSFGELQRALSYERYKRLERRDAKGNSELLSDLRTKFVDELFAQRYDFQTVRDDYSNFGEFRDHLLKLKEVEGKAPSEVMAPFIAEVDEALSRPPRWTDEDLKKIGVAFSFERAFRGHGCTTVRLTFTDDGFRADIRHSVEDVGDDPVSLCINISKIFAARDLII